MELLVGMLLVIATVGLSYWIETKRDTMDEPEASVVKKDSAWVILSTEENSKAVPVRSAIVQGVTADGKKFFWTYENGKLDALNMK